MISVKDRIAKSVYWIVWSRGGIQVLSFISTLMVARLLSPADYGVMALVGIWTASVSTIAELGLGAAIIQFRDLEARDYNTCFWLTLSLAASGYLTLYASAPLIAEWFGNLLIKDVLRVAGLSLLLVAVRVVPDSLLRKRLALDKISKAEIAAALVTIPLVVTMAWAGAGVWALVAGVLVQPFVQSIAIFWFVRWWPGLQVGGQRIKDVIHYSIATLGARICWVAYQQADTFVLGKVSGDMVLGMYSMAKQLASLPVEKVIGVVNQIASPMMAELQENRETMRTVFMRSLRLVTCITFPLCVGLLLEAEDFVRVALGTQWLSTVPVLKVLCVYAIVSSVAALFSPVLNACYRARYLFLYTLTQLIVMPCAFLAGAAQWGAVGVAIAWTTAYPLALIWLAREALREMNLSWRIFFMQFRNAATAVGVMTSIIILFHLALTRLEIDSATIRLGISVVLGALSYGTVLLRLGGPIRSEIEEVLRWIFQGKPTEVVAK